jgi:hypothetical protein
MQIALPPAMTRWLALAVALGASGCAPQYTYVPTTNATATVHGRVAADYPIPPNGAQGDVKIASFGLTDVAARNAPRERLRAIHLRVVLADNGPTAWTFDTREQRLDLNGVGPLVPGFASANAGTPPPVVTVEPNSKRVVDLFFVLPPALQAADEIPDFDAAWRVATGAGPIAEKTPFARLTVEPDLANYDDWDYGPNYYWGEPYWVNPAFPYAGIPFGYWGGGVDIHRAPHVGGARGFPGGGGFHGHGHAR